MNAPDLILQRNRSSNHELFCSTSESGWCGVSEVRDTYSQVTISLRASHKIYTALWKEGGGGENKPLSEENQSLEQRNTCANEVFSHFKTAISPSTKVGESIRGFVWNFQIYHLKIMLPSYELAHFFRGKKSPIKTTRGTRLVQAKSRKAKHGHSTKGPRD